MQKHVFTQTALVAGILGMATISSSAFGAGFEKNVLWSGKWVGVGGAAVSDVQGAESLFFNPSGLSGRQGLEVSGNFSPTWGEFKGPTGTSATQNSTGYNFSPAFGALLNYGITQQWGIGIGAFASAGTKADYGTISGFNSALPGFTPDVHADLYALEYSIGTGYEILPGLKIGAAWRIVHVQAGIGTVYPTIVGGTPTFANSVISDLGTTRYNGWRLGAMYTAPDHSWGLGATLRSGVDFTLKNGHANTTTYLGPAIQPTSTADGVTASSALPTQIEVGGNVALTNTVRGYLDYAWTNYSHDQNLSINGGGVADIPLGWTNLSNVRIGFACTAVQDWTFRAGYVYTSQVVPNTLARATFSSPGTGNTVTLGAGKTLMDKMLDLDAAVEHSWASGSTTADQQPAPFQTYGDYSSSDWVLHLGATLRI